MKVRINLDQALRLVGTNEKGHETFFDTSLKGGGLDSAPSPMEVVLESVAACTAMDVIPILRKQRKTVTDFSVDVSAERAEDHPKVFTKIEMQIRVVSPDATIKDLCRAIELSRTKYCSVSAMLRKSGCEITWLGTLVSPFGDEVQCGLSEFKSGPSEKTTEIPPSTNGHSRDQEKVLNNELNSID